jgi:hypothetical protein
VPTAEQMVAEFMAQARRADPVHYAEVCARYPVLSPQQLHRRRVMEVLVGDATHLASRRAAEGLEESGSPHLRPRPRRLPVEVMG